MPFLEIAPFKSLLSHSRFLITLRSEEGVYHSLILFRLSAGLDAYNHDTVSSTCAEKSQAEDTNEAADLAAQYKQIYAMEATCPHLGADLSHSDIEDTDTGLIAVCPWHRYDFDLRTGKSETGMKACTYTIDVRTDSEDGQASVWVEAPEGGSNWRMVELRPVSEEFADPPPQRANVQPSSAIPSESIPEEPVTPLENPPKTLMEWAVLILNTPQPKLKVARTRHAVHLFRTAQLSSIGHRSSNAPKPPDVPPREPQHQSTIVERNMVKAKRNRVGVLHALANVEQWAIDLAWDIMARFGPLYPDLPPAFFSDFTKMALDESKHFTLLTSRLTDLSPTTPYPFLPTHAALWDSASSTSTSLLSRLAIIHLVHEARGLDVNPRTIDRFRRAGDKESVKAMEVIHADEVTHVTAGHRWFTWLCAREEEEGKKKDPVQAFRDEVRRGWAGDIKGPFNVEDREKAGLSPAFYEELRGELTELTLPRQRQAKTEEQVVKVEGVKESAGNTIAYEQ